MSGYTHLAVGANAVWLAAVVGVVDERVIVLAGAGALAGLLADMDATHAKIQSMFMVVLRPFRIQGTGWWQHRGLAHSFIAVGMVFLLSIILLRNIHPPASLCDRSWLFQSLIHSWF